MPKKQSKETQAEQSARFRKAVRDMIAAGELNPTEADEAFERLIKNSRLVEGDSRLIHPSDSKGSRG